MIVKKLLLSTLIFLILFVTSTSFSQPSINSVSGTFTHKTAIVINGSGFGTKSPAAPFHWDDGSQWSNVDDIYTNHKPDAVANSYYNTQYRGGLPFRNVNGPHNHTTKIIAGNHHPDGYSPFSYSKGPTVHISRNSIGCPTELYVSWYYREDPLWPGSHNHKMFTLDSGTFPFNPEDFYMEYRPLPTASPGPCWHEMHGPCDGYYPCDNNPSKQVSNPKDGWTKIEMVIKNEAGGFQRTYQDNELAYTRTGCYPVGACANCIGIGTYWRKTVAEDGDLNAWRYFIDVYIDTTFSRVVLTNNSNYNNATNIELQTPTAWNNNSITVTVNLGKLTSGTAYLFIFNSNNNRNSTGFPVTISQGGGDDEPPNPPTGLKIVE